MGFVALATHAVCPSFFNDFSWQIPKWDTFNSWKSGPMLVLAHQAVCLRFCNIFLNQGILYLSLPCVFACTLAKIDELGKCNRLMWCLSKSLFMTSLSVVLFCLALGFASAPSNLPESGTFEAQLYATWAGCLFLIECALGSGIAPLFWLVTFVAFYFLDCFPRQEAPAQSKDATEIALSQM
jgi:hypothetical protein